MVRAHGLLGILHQRSLHAVLAARARGLAVFAAREYRHDTAVRIGFDWGLDPGGMASDSATVLGDLAPPNAMSFTLAAAACPNHRRRPIVGPLATGKSHWVVPGLASFPTCPQRRLRPTSTLTPKARSSGATTVSRSTIS